uniref:T9SS type A sorting domain-containing protein n=1 Tax=Prevotella sp. GTC17254 TaxID=3236794 RepID=A0AB33J8V5_9BACT
MKNVLLLLAVTYICPLSLQAKEEWKPVNTIQFKLDHTSDEQKGLAVTENGEIFLTGNAKELTVLNNSNQSTSVFNTVNSQNRAGILAKLDKEGNLIWSNLVAGNEGNNKNSQITCIKVMGNYVYVVGGVASNTKGESEVSVFGQTLMSAGYMDLYVAKIDKESGQTIWAKTFGNTRDWEMFISLAVDKKGNIYTSCIVGNIMSDPLMASPTIPLAATGNWGEDYGIFKFDSDGNVVWARVVGSKGRETDASPAGLAIDNDENLIFVGTSNDKGEDLSVKTEHQEYVVGDFTYRLYPDKSRDALLAKINATDGGIIWSRFLTGAGNQTLKKVDVLPDGKIVAVGTADSNISIQGSNGFAEQTVENSSPATFLAQFGVDGQFEWSKLVSGEHVAKEIMCDRKEGILLVGQFTSSVDFGNGINLAATEGNTKEGFIAQYNYQGQAVWAKKITSTKQSSLYHIDILGDNLVVSGFISADATLPKFQKEDTYTIGGANYKWFASVYERNNTHTNIEDIHTTAESASVHLTGRSLTLNSSIPCKLEIFTPQGVKVLERALFNREEVNLAGLPTGIFLVNVRDLSGNTIAANKIILQ